eukprot:6459022-Amphidinium_carterae.1
MNNLWRYSHTRKGIQVCKRLPTATVSGVGNPSADSPELPQKCQLHWREAAITGLLRFLYFHSDLNLLKFTASARAPGGIRANRTICHACRPGHTMISDQLKKAGAANPTQVETSLSVDHCKACTEEGKILIKKCVFNPSFHSVLSPSKGEDARAKMATAIAVYCDW